MIFELLIYRPFVFTSAQHRTAKERQSNQYLLNEVRPNTGTLPDILPVPICQADMK